MLKTTKDSGAPVVWVLSLAEKPLRAHTMTPVGKVMAKTNDTCCWLFGALELFCNSGWFHGDARHPNATKTVNWTILWVNLLDAALHNGNMQAVAQDKIASALSFMSPLGKEHQSALIAEMHGKHESDGHFCSTSF